MNQSETKQERLLLQEREVNLLSFNSNEELELIKKLTLEFEGDLTQLGSAIGCLFMCKTYGYKIIRLAYDAKTIAKYERFFQIVKGDFRFKNYS